MSYWGRIKDDLDLGLSVWDEGGFIKRCEEYRRGFQRKVNIVNFRYFEFEVMIN